MTVRYEEAQAFAAWLLQRIEHDARGDDVESLPLPPGGRLWLGRLAPEIKTRNSALGERGERMDPCEIGIRLRPTANDGRTVSCEAQAVAWTEDPNDPNTPPKWVKRRPIAVQVTLTAPTKFGDVHSAGREEIESALSASGAPGLSAEVRAELELGADGSPELVLTLLNTSPEEINDHVETNLYEVALVVDAGSIRPFQLDALPDSFRYSRDVVAYGVNCGVERISESTLRTTDIIRAARMRPVYWDEANAGSSPDLSFARLARDPLPVLDSFVQKLEKWGDHFWSERALGARASNERWTDEMRREAQDGAKAFADEVVRIRRGLEQLRTDASFLRAFTLMNRAFELASDKYDRWRAFQVGFLLSSLPSINSATREVEADFVDTLWFATGGGKTETYLAILVMAAFLDRLSGKIAGITAWIHFPLRMLSLQQTQRFADIFAAAELVRRQEKVPGAAFSVGFLVGSSATPNRIRREVEHGGPDWKDPEMPHEYQVLLRCPFCHRAENLEMRFDPTKWTLDHVCTWKDCPWAGVALPFRVVDEEIYRFLPTVVVGTLDKSANLGMQAAMRGFYTAPLGMCPAGHGFTYVPRSSTPNGCLYPGCAARPQALPQPADRFPPTIRMQDELHLLRDALGAVDSHYEGLYDHIQRAHGHKSKVLASSATLQGYPAQVRTLFQREGRLFPLPGPRSGHSFWSVDSDQTMRIFAGVAPRGVTIEFASDRTNEALQTAVRAALDHPVDVAHEIGVRPESVQELVSYYGVGVVYGSTIRDVEAATRSFETQIPIEPLNSVRLTGNTPFDEVRQALDRLQNDAAVGFGERIHLVAASSMLSHGVDLDRLNVMVMLGMPLSMAEFIQTTSRVGRKFPALVVVLHKISRERDASVFRSFAPFMEHADRLIDSIPITRKSRRVLEVTFPGIFQGRLLAIHEAHAVARSMPPLTTLTRVRQAFGQLPVLEDDEYDALVELLGLDSELDENMKQDLRKLVREAFRAINDPATSARFVSEVLPGGEPMRSLRDVEEQVPVYTRAGP